MAASAFALALAVAPTSVYGTSSLAFASTEASAETPAFQPLSSDSFSLDAFERALLALSVLVMPTV